MLHFFRWSLSLAIVGAACLGTWSSAWAGAIVDSPNIRITDAGLDSVDAEHVRIVEQKGTLYAVWEDGRDGNDSSVYFAKSTDGGESWGRNVRVSLFPEDDWINYPDIAVQPDGTIWVVWHRFYTVESTTTNDIMLAKSTDGGTTFTVYRLFNGVDKDENLWRSRIVADASDGGLYIMSQLYNGTASDEGMDLLFIRHVAATDTWEGQIINDVARAGRIPERSLLDYGAWFSLTARNGVVCAAWEDRGRNSSERQPLYGACSTDGGATFAPDFKISENDGVWPEIALGPNGELYTAYSLDTDARNNIRVRHSTDLGVTWGPTRQVTAVGISDIDIWVVGVDENGQLLIPYTQKDVNDIFLATSIDQGVNFALTPIFDGQGKYPSAVDFYDPALAIGGTGDTTRAYVAWQDDRNVDDELWSARISLDSLPPSTPDNVTISAQERALRLNWGASTDTNSVAGYRVYRAAAADGPFNEITARLVSATSYVDVELGGTTYFYRVAAVDGTGNTSSPSTVVSGAAASPGAPQFGGQIAYEAGDAIHLRKLDGDPAARTLTEARQPRFGSDGARIYYLSQATISSQPVGGGAPEIFFANEGLAEYDLAAADAYYGVIIARNFGALGVVGGVCFVSEPHYGRPGQNIYAEQYDLGSDVALSNDRKWLVYRTAGFCNVAAAGVYSPPKLCLIDLANDPTNNDAICLEGHEYRTPDFAPAGHWLAFSADFTDQEEIWKALVQEDGSLSNFVQLSRGPANQPSRAPSWSSDGNWIIFQRDVDPGASESWQLHVVRSDGVGVRSLGLAGEEPAWLGGGPSDELPPTPPGDETLYLPILIRK